MTPTMRCLVLFSACSILSACSDAPTSKKEQPKQVAKPLVTELGAPRGSAMHDKALTASAPAAITSVAHTVDKTVQKAEIPAAPDPEKAPKLEATSQGDSQADRDAKQEKVEELDFDRPLDPSEVSVKRFVLATDVKDREPVGESDVFMTDTSKIFAFVELANEAAPYAVRVHWEQVDEKPSPYGVRLDVKTSPRFRTWSWTAIKRAPGKYKAVLRTLDGKDIASREFTLEPGEDCAFHEE